MKKSANNNNKKMKKSDGLVVGKKRMAMDSSRASLRPYRKSIDAIVRHKFRDTRDSYKVRQ